MPTFFCPRSFQATPLFANPFRARAAINACMEITADIHWLPARSECVPVAITPAAISSELLMQKYGNGDDAAFRILYARHRAPLMRFSQCLCGNRSEAEEIFQDTWIAVINARARYTVRARFTSWLFAIAHRRAADGHRKRARHPTNSWLESAAQIDTHLASLAAEPAQAAVDGARQCALDAAIAALPFEQREVFLLRAETGLGVREIAAITRTPAETTKSRLRYALRALRKAMASWV